MKQEIENWIEKNKDEILQGISGLIQIRTENLPPTGNEKPGQEYLYNKISKYIPEDQIDIFEVDDVKSIREHPLFFPTVDGVERDYRNRPNLVVKIPGKKQGKSLLFSGHMDVMPVKEEKWEVFSDPYSGKIKDGKLYGRGSMDMKAGTMAGFYAIKCLKDLGISLNGDLYAESVVDEENGGVNGTIAARLRYPNIDFAILPESSGMVAGIETLGGSDWEAFVDVKGPGGFGFGVELQNPVYKLSKVAIALEKYDKLLKTIKASKNYKSQQFIRVLTFQLMSGGSNYLQSGAVPTKGHIYFWVEAFANVTEEEYKRKFLDFMKEELSRYDDFKDDFPLFKTSIRVLEGHVTDTSHPAMSSLKKAHEELGLNYNEDGLGFACDAFAFKKAGNTEVVVLGPRGANPHGMDEYVKVKDILELIKIMVLTAIDYCGL
jgi:acetylornithine deacetylase